MKRIEHRLVLWMYWCHINRVLKLWAFVHIKFDQILYFGPSMHLINTFIFIALMYIEWLMNLKCRIYREKEDVYPPIKTSWQFKKCFVVSFHFSTEKAHTHTRTHTSASTVMECNGVCLQDIGPSESIKRECADIR